MKKEKADIAETIKQSDTCFVFATKGNDIVVGQYNGMTDKMFGAIANVFMQDEAIASFFDGALAQAAEWKNGSKSGLEFRPEQMN